MKVLFNLKATVLASILALTLLFFLGTFSNSFSTKDASFSEESWYYINRGFPKAWAGVALADTKVNFPRVVLPFLAEDDGRGTELIKIVDVRLFVPLFLLIFTPTYFPSFILAKASDENKQLLPLFVVLTFMATCALLFTYFALFLRI